MLYNQSNKVRGYVGRFLEKDSKDLDSDVILVRDADGNIISLG